MAHAMQTKTRLTPAGRGHPARGDAGAMASALAALAFWFSGADLAHAQAAKAPSPSMGPLEQCRRAGAADEIAMARRGAPPSISSAWLAVRYCSIGAMLG